MKFLVADPRVKDWLLITSPWPIIVLDIAYLSFVHFGQKVMANRKPFELKGPMIIYNLVLVILSAYMFIEVSDLGTTLLGHKGQDLNAVNSGT
jgi:hypothetical protein